MKLKNESREYSVVLAKAFWPSRCCKCGKFVGRFNLKGRPGIGRKFICNGCFTEHSQFATPDIPANDF